MFSTPLFSNLFWAVLTQVNMTEMWKAANKQLVVNHAAVFNFYFSVLRYWFSYLEATTFLQCVLEELGETSKQCPYFCCFPYL